MIRNNRFSEGSLIPNKDYTTSSSAAFLKVEYEDIFAGYGRDFIVLAADKKDSRPQRCIYTCISKLQIFRKQIPALVRKGGDF